MSNNELLLKSAKRLGVDDSAVVLKSEAYYRVLDTKPISKTLTDIAKAVLCLDLAANNLGSAFDKGEALGLTGLKKAAYQNKLNNVEKALDLDKPLTVSELCVQMGYSEVKDLAENILTQYKNHDTKIKDIHHPQYIAASVFTACKIKNIKTENSKFVTISRLKQMKWKKLAEEFLEFSKTMGLTKTTNVPKSTKTVEFNESPEKMVKHKKKEEEEQFEDYEVWKRRIIDEANAEIQQMMKS